jgi:hypothetical protein
LDVARRRGWWERAQLVMRGAGEPLAEGTSLEAHGDSQLEVSMREPEHEAQCVPQMRAARPRRARAALGVQGQAPGADAETHCRGRGGE